MDSASLRAYRRRLSFGGRVHRTRSAQLGVRFGTSPSSMRMRMATARRECDAPRTRSFTRDAPRRRGTGSAMTATRATPRHQQLGNRCAALGAGPAVDTALAVMHDGFGDIGALSLRTRKSEPLGEGQIRVAITVAGLNPIDWQIVESEALASAFGISTPSGFGNDFAGTVVEIGRSVNRWRVGDRVYGGARGAAVATSVVLDEDHRSLQPASDTGRDQRPYGRCAGHRGSNRISRRGRLERAGR